MAKAPKQKAQYDVASGDSVQDLRIQVQLKMSGGWLPQGGLVVYDGAYHQAMVRHLEEAYTSDILYNDLHHDI